MTPKFEIDQQVPIREHATGVKNIVSCAGTLGIISKLAENGDIEYIVCSTCGSEQVFFDALTYEQQHQE